MNDYGLHALQASWQVLDGLLDGIAREPVAIGAALVALVGLTLRAVAAPARAPFAQVPAAPEAPFAGETRPLATSDGAAEAVAAAASPTARGLLAVETPGGGE